MHRSDRGLTVHLRLVAEQAERIAADRASADNLTRGPGDGAFQARAEAKRPGTGAS